MRFSCSSGSVAVAALFATGSEPMPGWVFAVITLVMIVTLLARAMPAGPPPAMSLWRPGGAPVSASTRRPIPLSSGRSVGRCNGRSSGGRMQRVLECYTCLTLQGSRLSATLSAVPQCAVPQIAASGGRPDSMTTGDSPAGARRRLRLAIRRLREAAGRTPGPGGRESVVVDLQGQPYRKR